MINITENRLRKLVRKLLEANRSLAQIDSKKNRSLAQNDSKNIDETDDSDDVNYAYDLWSKNQRGRGPDKPKPEKPPSESPAVIEVKDKVLSFLEGAGLGEPKQMGIQHRWTVEPHPGVEFDFHVTARNDKPRLVIKLSAIRDFLPGNTNVYAEDVGLVAENLVKISQVLKALDDSGLPIHMISFSARQ